MHVIAKCAFLDPMPLLHMLGQAAWNLFQQGVNAMQASAVQERFQAAVVDFQGVLTVTNIVKLWMQSSH